jgi:hypothetical protein
LLIQQRPPVQHCATHNPRGGDGDIRAGGSPPFGAGRKSTSSAKSSTSVVGAKREVDREPPTHGLDAPDKAVCEIAPSEGLRSLGRGLLPEVLPGSGVASPRALAYRVLGVE